MALAVDRFAVWFVPSVGELSADHLSLLSSQERDRVGRLLRPEDQRSYGTAHASLRLILGAILGLPTRAAEFVSGPSASQSFRTVRQGPGRISVFPTPARLRQLPFRASARSVSISNFVGLLIGPFNLLPSFSATTSHFGLHRIHQLVAAVSSLRSSRQRKRS